MRRPPLHPLGDAWLAGLVTWLGQPAFLVPLPTATRAESLWLVLSLVGLLFTLVNLVSAVRAAWWQDRYQPDATLLNEIANAHRDKAAALVLIDLACVLIGVAAVLNLAEYPAVLVLGLLILRLLLPGVAFRDVLLRQRVAQIERRRRWRAERARHTTQAGGHGETGEGEPEGCRNG